MRDYCWRTEEAHATNQDTMSDYINSEMPEEWVIKLCNGTYAEVITTNGELFEVHAMGDGNFNNHRVRFVRINEPTRPVFDGA